MSYAQKDLFKRAALCSTVPAKLAPSLKEGKLTLHIEGMTVPNFKNAKRWITSLPNGKPLKRAFLITLPKHQEMMKQITQGFVSQLHSVFQTVGGVTLTEPMKRSLIASLLPRDDSWLWMPETLIKAELCQPGDEGATITIERL